LAITPLTGIKIIITANPARTDAPANNTISYTTVLTGSIIAILVSSSNMKLIYKISLQNLPISKMHRWQPFPSNKHIHIFSRLQDTGKVQTENSKMTLECVPLFTLQFEWFTKSCLPPVQ
jgi:hypothetical protein